MKKLAKREEQIMQILWRLEKAFVREILNELPEPKPHYNSVATILGILKKKGFVDLKSLGNARQYFPLVTKTAYQKEAVGDVLHKYFDNSYQKMVAHFAKEEKISEAELEQIIKMIKDAK